MRIPRMPVTECHNENLKNDKVPVTEWGWDMTLGPSYSCPVEEELRENLMHKKQKQREKEAKAKSKDSEIDLHWVQYWDFQAKNKNKEKQKPNPRKIDLHWVQYWDFQATRSFPH